MWRKLFLMSENWRERKMKKIKGWIWTAAWFRLLRYIHPFSTCVTSFNLLGLTVPEKSVTKNFNVWKLERKKNKGRRICSRSLIPVHTVPETSVMKNFNVRKLERKNEEIKGWIRSSSLIPVHTIHLPTVHVCTKFQSSRPHSSWEKYDEKF